MSSTDIDSSFAESGAARMLQRRHEREKVWRASEISEKGRGVE